MYFWLDTTRLRMVISERLDKDSAARIRNVRPTPNNYAIVGTAKNVTEIFRIVRMETYLQITKYLI